MSKTAHLIDPARMQTVYNHLQHNPEISDLLEVVGKTDEQLADIGDMLVEGDTLRFAKAIEDGKVRRIKVGQIPTTNYVRVLYLPPLYVVMDMRCRYE